MAQRDRNWRTTAPARRREERQTLLVCLARCAEQSAIASLRSSPQASWPEPTTTGRANSPALERATCLRGAAEVRKWTDCQGGRRRNYQGTGHPPYAHHIVQTHLALDPRQLRTCAAYGRG